MDAFEEKYVVRVEAVQARTRAARARRRAWRAVLTTRAMEARRMTRRRPNLVIASDSDPERADDAAADWRPTRSSTRRARG